MWALLGTKALFCCCYFFVNDDGAHLAPAQPYLPGQALARPTPARSGI